MKKITLVLMLMLATVSFGQIKKVESAPRTEIGRLKSGTSLAMKCEKEGNTYYFTFEDVSLNLVKNQKTFKIEDIDNAFETLYAMVKEGVETQPKEFTVLEVENGYVYLMYSKTMGIKCVSFGHSLTKGEDAVISYSSPFNKKQVDKLFGKKD